MSRITHIFSDLRQANKVGLIPFITAGDPHPDVTVACMHALVRGGANIIELGVPFSDPMADGPIIQRASERALAHGMNLALVLDLVAQFREQDASTPVVLMGYANPIERMGVTHFIKRAQQVGVDGVLVVDYPFEEARAFGEQLRQHDIDPICLLAPTSSDIRIVDLATVASGYVYYVSLRGVTGSAALDISSVDERVRLIKRKIDLPIAVGFGIREAQTSQAIGQYADAVVMGSRLVQLLEETPHDQVVQSLQNFTMNIRVALDSGRNK